MRYSVHSTGRQTRSIGIPGSGVSYIKTRTGGSGSRSKAQPREQSVPAAGDAAAVLPKPGFFASKVEKRYHEGLHAFIRGDADEALASFTEVLAKEPDLPSAHLFSALAIGLTDGPDAEQIRHLEAVIESDVEMPDRLQAKYLPPGRVDLGMAVKITDLASAQAPFDSVGATLMLAEHYQDAGRLDEAIGLVQQLSSVNAVDPGIRLSLTDLLSADRDYDAVIEVARDASNDSDAGVALLHLKGGALFALGHQTAALDAFREALAKTANRNPELLKAVRYDRALAYEADGQKSRARQDLERLFGVDPDYEDVRERLASISQTA